MRAPVIFWLSLLLVLPLPLIAAAQPLKIAVLGDSLSAGYRLEAGADFPAQLERALQQRGHAVEVVNAGVSGDTSAGGRARLDWTLADRPDLVLVELGGNDALRGIDPEETRRNLDAILSRLKQDGIGVFLAGMRAPRNLGRSYYSKFDLLYTELARRHGVPLYPFFLEGVAGEPALNLDDGIHPNAAGVREIVRRILPQVEETLKALATTAS